MGPIVEPSAEDVREELNAICSHKRFTRSDRLRHFLRFIVEQKLAGKNVNEQLIGVNVFERSAGYDSGSETIVRTEAVALRKRLAEYYRDNPSARVRISLPKGNYNPTFTWLYQVAGRPETADALAFREEPELIEEEERSRESALEAAKEERVVVSEVVAPPLARPRFALNWKTVVAASLVVAAILTGLLVWRLRRTARLTENHAIVVADFVNTTGEAIFDGTLKEALTVQLEQSPYLNVLSDAKVAATLKLMNRPSNERLTEQVAQEICERTNSQALMVGSIARVGNPYLIALKAVNCQTAQTLASAEATANNRDALLGGVKTAAMRLRQKLGESLASVQKFNSPLDSATTSSLEALKAFSEGGRLIKEKGEADAIPYFQRAIELDPNFADAYMVLGTIYTNSGEIGLAQKNVRKAFELRDRVTEGERLSIVAIYYLVVTGELEKSMEALRHWARRDPSDKFPHLNLSAEYVMMGDYDKAAAEGQQTIRLDPDNFSGYGNPISAYFALNRLDEAKALIEQARAKGLESSVGFSAYLLAFLEGNEPEMRKQLMLAKGKRWIEDAVVSSASDTEAYHGRLSKARELSAEAVDAAERNGAKETAALWKVNEALREAEFGNVELARKDANIAMNGGGNRDVSVLAALALARAGRPRQAQKIVTQLDAQFPLNSLLQHYWLPTIRAAVELDRGNANAAIEALQGKTAYELGAPEQFNLGPMYPVYVRGEAYLKASRGHDAAEQFREIIEHPGITLNFPLGSLAHLQLARALGMAGDNAGARKEYRDFFALWKDADPDIPILNEAKAEYGKL